MRRLIVRTVTMRYAGAIINTFAAHSISTLPTIIKDQVIRGFVRYFSIETDAMCGFSRLTSWNNANG